MESLLDVGEDMILEILRHLDGVSLIQVFRTCKYLWKFKHNFSRKITYQEWIEKRNWDKGLCLAVKNSDMEYIQLFMRHYIKEWSEVISEAASKGDVDLVNFFLRHKKDYYESALSGAAFGGHKNLIEQLCSQYEFSPFEMNRVADYAAEGGHTELYQWFVDKGYTGYRTNWFSTFQSAAKMGNKELINLLINLGNTEWDYGLAGAIEGNQMDLIEFFVEKGASDWNRALCSAVHSQNKELIQYCIQKGATQLDFSLEIAAQVGNMEIIQLLEQQGVNNFNVALADAARFGHRTLIDHFIEKGANDWNAALDNATWGCHVDLVNLFISKGADCWNKALLTLQRQEKSGTKDLREQHKRNTETWCGYSWKKVPQTLKKD